MRVNTRVVCDIETGKVLARDSFEYCRASRSMRPKHGYGDIDCVHYWGSDHGNDNWFGVSEPTGSAKTDTVAVYRSYVGHSG